MAILTADLKFFAAQYATDDTYGGGPMSSTVVQDGVSSNVFPVIGEIDAAIGRLQLRKVYAAVLSANTDALVNSSVHLYTPPTDAQVDVSLFSWGDRTTTRAQAAAALANFPYTGDASANGTVSGSGTTRTFSNESTLQVGDRIILGFWSSGVVDSNFLLGAKVLATVTGIAGSDVTYSEVVADTTGSAINRWFKAVPSALAPRVCAAAALGGAVSASDTVLPLAGPPEVSIVPAATPYQTAPQGITSDGLRMANGRVPIFRVGDVVHIREVDGTPSEIGEVAWVDYFNEEIELVSPLANAYPSGALVSALCSLGDMQAQVGTVFSQQTWTRVFSDALIGNSIGSNYNRALGEIIVTNEGAETERWAIVFTSATDFKLIGETYGQIAAGETGVDFSPLNPVTSQPLFTIEAAGWGTGWQAGNVLRLNTVGARAPFWSARCISPGATDATDGAEIEMRGSY